MPDVRMDISDQPKFSEIVEHFKQEGTDGDRKLRFGEKGLYVKGTDSLGSPLGVRERTQKREAAIEQLKLAIDREHGDGVGDSVFQSLQEGGTNLSGGVRVRDLDRILAQVALTDPDCELLERGSKATEDVVSRYVARHFELFSSDQFWMSQDAMNIQESFGCALSIAVLDRIKKMVRSLRRTSATCNALWGRTKAGTPTAPGGSGPSPLK